MKNINLALKKTHFIIVIFVFVLLMNCDGNLLDVSPSDQLSQDALWDDPNLIEQYLNDIYRGIGHGYYAVSISSGVDETKHTHGWDDDAVRQSNITPDFAGFFTTDWANWFPQYRWSELYNKIRDANAVIENIDSVENIPESLRNQLKGEALFLRAKFYHNLLKLHGGVPLVTSVFSLDDDFLLPRDSFEETVNLIVDDLNTAAELLPPPGSVVDGRATDGAALALKSRVLLFAASDLYNVNPSGMPETGYTGGSQSERWRAAKNAAVDVMDLGYYNLYMGNPAPGDSTAKNYADIFLVRGHNENIFVRHFSNSQSFEWFEVDIGLFNSPNGYNAWGGDVPLQQHVDAYEMADGTEFDWSNLDHSENPYLNRDPRFYASIFYNGAKWRERPSDVLDLDPDGRVEVADFEIPGSNDLRPGIDTRNGPVLDWNGTYTGYYMRKFLDINVDHQFEIQEHPWVFMRYAEILLNYAEASVELGEYQDARDALNPIRQRAGMPEIPPGESGMQLLERVRNERRIELAFENQRYFDVRRWMIAPDIYENGLGVRIVGSLNEDNTTYTFEYSVRDVDQRQWNDNAYFIPVPRSEIDANVNIVQNPGYN